MEIMGPNPNWEIGDAITFGWRKLKDNLGPFLLFMLIQIGLGAIGNGLGFRADFDPDTQELITTGSPVVSFIFFVVNLVLSMIVIHMALSAVRGEPVSIGDSISRIMENPIQILWFFLVQLIVSILVFVGFILCIIPAFFVAGMFFIAPYLVVDRDEGIDALGTALNASEGQRGKLALFIVALIGLNLAGALACGIGLFVTVPISWIAAAYVFDSVNPVPPSMEAIG